MRRDIDMGSKTELVAEQPYILMSIDSSTKSTGLALWENGVLKETVGIDLSKDKQMKKMDARFPHMARRILETLDKHMPDEVCMEEAVVLRNAQTQRFLVRLSGVIYGWCLQHGADFVAIRPTEWRKLLGFQQGRNVAREQLKNQAWDFVKQTMEMDTSDMTEDVCESICIGQAILRRQKMNAPNK